MSYVRLAFSSRLLEKPDNVKSERRSLTSKGGIRPESPRLHTSDFRLHTSDFTLLTSHPLSSLTAGTRATVIEISAQAGSRADRLLALGVTPGASVMVLQTFPGVVFRCDQTELAVERSVAGTILVRVQETPS
jgi:Fe2+ transport system protein FeoA